MQVNTRFAPSPTGHLHFGGARTALIAWLFARSHQGKYILRIDDTDTERSTQAYADSIKRDLEWLGLDWDMELVQSKRMERYDEVKKQLLAQGDLYPCYETPEELQLNKKALLSANKPPIYGRQALQLSEAQKRHLEASGIQPHYRFLLRDGAISWDDLVRGHLHFDSKNLSDPVLVRADGSMTYSIASVVDDMDYHITHIIRAEDHISNSALHIRMFEALGVKTPHFAHLSLIRNNVGGKMSKREGGFTIASLREAGMEPLAVLSLLAKMGTSDAIEVAESMEQLLSEFSLQKQSKAPSIYNSDELLRLNTNLVHHMPFSAARSKLAEIGIGDADETFWNTVRRNINTVAEAKEWHDICCTPITPVQNNLPLTTKAAQLLPPAENWSINTWQEWITNVQQATGIKGKALFMPIRLALTGLDHGPELRLVLLLLGHKRSYDRLMGIAA